MPLADVAGAAAKQDLFGAESVKALKEVPGMEV